jgi:tetratricopeptide (TPR) repeat protein
MICIVGRFGWLLAVVLGVCVLGAGPAIAQMDEKAALAAFTKGQEFQKEGKWKEAAASYEEARKLAPEVFDKDNVSTADILNILGQMYSNSGQYAKAEPLYKRSLKIKEDKLGKDHPIVANTLNNLALLYKDMGQYARAEPLFLRALQINEDKLGKDDPAVATNLGNLAALYYQMGQYAKAEPLFQRSLKIDEDKRGKDHPDVATDLNNLAGLYVVMGQYAKAEPLYQRSLEIWEDKLGKDHPNVAQGLNNLAGLYQEMGQYAKAEPLFLRSLQIRENKLGKDHPAVATGLNHLAELYRVMGQYAKAEPLYQRSLGILEDKLGKDHPEVAMGLNNLAGLYQVMGQYAKAEPLYRRSLKIYEDKLGKDHPYLATGLNNLAELYKATGQYDKAEPLYRRSLKIYEDKLGKDHPYTATGHTNLATLFAAMQRWEEASEAADQDRRIVRRNVARLLPTLPEKEQLAFLEHKDVANFCITESLALARRGDAAIAGLSAGWVLNGKAVAHEALAQRALTALDARDPAARELSQQLLGVRSRLASLDQVPAKAGQEDQRRKEIDELNAQDKDLSGRLAKVSGRTARAEPWVELAEIRKALPPDSVLIEISKFQVFNLDAKGKDKKRLGYRYAAWVITTEGDVHMVDLGPADPIDDAVKDVRQALKEAQGSPKHPSTITEDGEPEAEKALLKPLQTLSKLVLDPLAEHIDGKKRWYVSPDASLWLVPWAALPLKDGRYAVEAHTISYLVSGRDLAAVPSKAKPGRPRMMADPDYDMGMTEARVATRKLVAKPEMPDPSLRGASPSLGRMRAPRLPGTATEAQAVKPALEKYADEEASLFQQDEALEGVFKSFRGPRVLVLSTHGFFLEDQVVAPSDKIGREDEKRPALDKEGKPLENPLLRCGLLLAGCNNRDQAKEGDEDGVLTGLEVAGTDLRGTELVVLSACETGLGEVHNGEGVAGLRQAFQLAGARAVAATLWQIPDRESAKLMGDFFANLGDGKGKAEALRDAQLAMIQTRREKNAAAHPFFWAAFTLTGQ